MNFAAQLQDGRLVVVENHHEDVKEGENLFLWHEGMDGLEYKEVRVIEVFH